MTARWLFGAIGVLATVAGTAMWLGMRQTAPAPHAEMPSPSVLFAIEFTDARGGPRTLARFQSKPMVVNFWATWCAPCREEMPAFARLQRKWAGKVQFVGLSSEDAGRVLRFATDHGVDYPLWVGDDRIEELSRRLGNARQVLPFTALVDGAGRVVEVKVGPYSEAELDAKLQRLAEIRR